MWNGFAFMKRLYSTHQANQADDLEPQVGVDSDVVVQMS